MKILIYSANFAPESTGIGKYSGEMAAWLAARGHDVRAVAAPPYYPAWKVEQGYQWPPYQRTRWQGVDVWRAPLWVPGKPNGISRVLHLLTFAVSSLPLMLLQLLWRPALVLTVAPALVCAPIGCLVAKLSGAKSWIHIQDFEVDVAFQMGLLKGRWMQTLVCGCEHWLLRRFHVASSISNRMLERLRQKGVADARLQFFPNWVDTEHIYPLDQPSSYRAELALAATTQVVLYAGTLGGKQGLMVIPDAARRLTHRSDLLFVVCGDGVLKPELQAACADLPNVRFLPLQPFARLGQLLGLADIHLLPQSPEAADLVLPSKLSGMLASGRPVIATCVAGTEIALVVAQCGTVVPPENGQQLALAIEQLVDDAALRTRLGIKARQYAQQYLERDVVLGHLLQRMQSNEKAGNP